MTQCPGCGSQVSGKFCPNCGAQVVQDAAATAMPVPPPMPPQPAFQPQQPGFQPQQPGYPLFPAQQKKSGWLKWVLIGVGVLAVLFVALSFIGSSGGISGTPTISTHVDPDTKGPTENLTTVPSYTEKIYASVQVKLKAGTIIRVKWYTDGMYKDEADFKYRLTEDYNGWVSPYITMSGQHWPAGNYKVEFYLNDQKASEKSFAVK